MSLKEPEEANAEGLRFWKKKNKEVFLFHSILRKVWKEISFFQKKKVFSSFNILLPFQPRTLKKSYFNLLNLKQTFFKTKIFQLNTSIKFH